MESGLTDLESPQMKAGAEGGAEGRDRLAARFFQALSDPTRLALLRLLRSEGKTVGELVVGLAVPQPKVSRHLRVLREAGLVVASKEGRNVRCRLTLSKHWPREGRAWLESLMEGLPLVDSSPGEPRAAAPRSSAGAAGASSVAARPPARTDLETHLL